VTIRLEDKTGQLFSNHHLLLVAFPICHRQFARLRARQLPITDIDLNKRVTVINTF
jgi:hypothetical protein